MRSCDASRQQTPADRRGIGINRCDPALRVHRITRHLSIKRPHCAQYLNARTTQILPAGAKIFGAGEWKTGTLWAHFWAQWFLLFYKLLILQDFSCGAGRGGRTLPRPHYT